MSSSTVSAEEHCLRAKACLKQRDAQGAIAAYQEAVSKFPDTIAAHEGIARIAFLQQNYDLALTHFKKVAALNPKSIEPLINQGAVCNRMGDYQQAIKILRQALARDRRSAEAYYNLGIAQRGSQQLQMAVSAYKEAIRYDPEMHEAYSNLGKVLIELKSYSQAIQNFERALQIKPDFEKARSGLLKARELVESAKRATKPFGRLVDVAEVERKNAAAEQKFRELNPQERFEDRELVHRLSKEAEHLAGLMLQQLREELSPALLKMSRIVSERHNVREWMGDADVLHRAVGRTQGCSATLFEKLDDLRKHEKFIRN
ncbi:tetratricopeptide repeat protein [Planctomicrobium sp. SH664]|uniref:tetratricopeptide repeat protein n=1 Tax=Planctomicrobium sp. SH664 TaxID=3448125 RepID=UPI003F5C30E6